MKKFLVFLVILVVLAGTVFFLGWAQFAVPPGSIGVMRSKTNGIDPTVIREGEFRWYWYKVIPTNAVIDIFTIKPVNRTINSSGTLPSGTVYASAAGVSADFSWSVTGEFSFSVKPESLPSLCQKNNISSQEDLAALETSYGNSIETLILNRMNTIAQDKDKMASLVMSGMLPELNQEIINTFPELEKINCVIRTVRYPDYELYQSVRNLYNDYLSRQEKILQNYVLNNADSNMGTRLRMDDLEKIGDLLTRYPVLMQLFAMDKDLTTILTIGQ